MKKKSLSTTSLACDSSDAAYVACRYYPGLELQSGTHLSNDSCLGKDRRATVWELRSTLSSSCTSKPARRQLASFSRLQLQAALFFRTGCLQIFCNFVRYLKTHLNDSIKGQQSIDQVSSVQSIRSQVQSMYKDREELIHVIDSVIEHGSDSQG